MKKTLFAMLAFVIGGIGSVAMAEDVLISTNNTSMLLRANEGEPLKIAYYGSRISQDEVAQVWNSGLAFDRPAYPTFNSWPLDEAAIEVEHTDGSISLNLVVVNVTRESTDKGEMVRVLTRDKVYPFEVVNCYRSFTDSNIIEMWSEISHSEKKGDVKLAQFASAYLPIHGNQVWLSHLHGCWANEVNLFEEPLTAGMKVIKNRDGVRNGMSDHPEVMLSLDGKPSEETGRVIGAALCYSGNYKLRIDTDIDMKYLHHFIAGIDETASQYYLKAGETFVTPELALTYSECGKGGVSRNFHNWARRDGKLHNGTALRDVLLNSWEGVYFDVDNDKMFSLMRGVAEIGGELFVMDDGWFASEKYQRLTDNAALGDWAVDYRKLPDGLQPLVDEAKKNNIKFGIWIEPEMCNWESSELYEKHPDWILQYPGREPLLGRGGTQMVLDLTNPEVQDFVFSIVDNLMTECPDIAYMKWDANMSLTNYGSPYLPKNRQSHIYIEYHKGLRNVLERIRAKYPDLILQACASGGGRANYGVLPYYDEFWTSDDTDALQRIYMQWGTSMFYPAAGMASHVSASPNHQTGRVIPLKFRFDVAMTGRLGIEMKTSDFSPEELEFAKQAVSDYKRLREVIQQGDLYRLRSPYEGNGDVSSLMYVSPDKQKAVFFGFKLKHFASRTVPPFRMAGLDPDKNYRLHEINANNDGMKEMEGAVFSGRLLMSQGIALVLGTEYSSRVFELTAID